MSRLLAMVAFVVVLRPSGATADTSPFEDTGLDRTDEGQLTSLGDEGGVVYGVVSDVDIQSEEPDAWPE